jgi:hypothetical protein
MHQAEFKVLQRNSSQCTTDNRFGSTIINKEMNIGLQLVSLVPTSACDNYIVINTFE